MFQEAAARGSLNSGSHEGPGTALVFQLAREAAIRSPLGGNIAEVEPWPVNVPFEREEPGLGRSIAARIARQRQDEQRQRANKEGRRRTGYTEAGHDDLP